MKKNGFTLIELLIVITIIGILAVALLPGVIGAPARARDAQRKADLKIIATAIEAFQSDSGNYPLKSTKTACIGNSDALGINKCFSGGKPPLDPQKNLLFLAATTVNMLTVEAMAVNLIIIWFLPWNHPTPQPL